MFVFAFPILAVVAIGLLAFSMTASNHYYTGAHTEGYWQAFVHNLTTGFGLTTVVKRLFTQVVSNWMSRAAEAVDAPIGTMFHYLATEVKAWADTNLEFSAFALTVAGAITGQVSWREVNVALKELRHTITVAEHRAQVATNQAIAEEHNLVNKLRAGVYPRLTALDHAIDVTIPKEFKHLGSEVKAAEDHAINTWKWIKRHPGSVVTTAFAGAVAVALGKLGMGWLRCNSARQFGRKFGCGIWGDLEGLLVGAAVFGLVVDFRDIVKAAVALEGDVAGALGKLATLDDAAIQDAAHAVADAANSIAT